MLFSPGSAQLSIYTPIMFHHLKMQIDTGKTLDSIIL